MAYALYATWQNFVGSMPGEEMATLRGSTVADVFAQHLRMASSEIDARLAKVYVVPFNATTDTPPTPAQIELLALRLTTESLLDLHGAREQAAAQRAVAERFFASLIDGSAEIPNVTKVDADDSRTPLAYSAGRPAFPGRVNDGVDNVTDTPRGSRW